jgi:UDP-N-acetyl-D-mannosaminuronic acid dehydrogenase
VAQPTGALEDALSDADIVVVATNHSEFSRPGLLHVIADTAASDCLVVDPWNAFGAAQVFGYASEIAALARTPAA